MLQQFWLVRKRLGQNRYLSGQERFYATSSTGEESRNERGNAPRILFDVPAGRLDKDIGAQQSTVKVDVQIACARGGRRIMFGC